jgi:hypothetical protein
VNALHGGNVAREGVRIDPIAILGSQGEIGSWRSMILARRALRFPLGNPDFHHGRHTATPID